MFSFFGVHGVLRVVAVGLFVCVRRCVFVVSAFLGYWRALFCSNFLLLTLWHVLFRFFSGFDYTRNARYGESVCFFGSACGHFGCGPVFGIVAVLGYIHSIGPCFGLGPGQKGGCTCLPTC